MLKLWVLILQFSNPSIEDHRIIFVRGIDNEQSCQEMGERFSKEQNITSYWCGSYNIKVTKAEYNE